MAGGLNNLYLYRLNFIVWLAILSVFVMVGQVYHYMARPTASTFNSSWGNVGVKIASNEYSMTAATSWLTRIAQLPTKRWPWVLLALSSFALIGAAMYFQYAMDLKPCVRCIYQRTAVLAIGLVALIPLINPHIKPLKWLGLLGWLGIAVWGYVIAADHVALQQSANSWFAVCDINPRFPEFMPLHEWFPGFFGAPGTCGDIDWQLVGLSMPQWLQLIFAGYAVTAGAVIAAQLLGKASQQ
jgi:disulfide bond formation protein DsbB